MTGGVRALGVLLLAGLLAVIGFWMTRDGADPTAAVTRWQSSEQCRECHQSVYDEWQGSHHQIAFLNPEVRKLSDDFRNKECQACHLPRPVSITGFGERTLPRLTFPNEGVSCLTCHLGASGEILGAATREAAPCRPVESLELVSTELCKSCHNQHQTTDQWHASPQAAAGGSCRSCHMPPVERPPQESSRAGFAHDFKGAHDLEMLRSAGVFSVEADADSVLLSLENVGAGHNFPTEERHRAVDILVQFQSAAGAWGPWEHVYRFREPYRDETGPNTQLPAGERKEVKVARPDGAIRVRARLWYRLTPYVGDDDPRSSLLFEEELELP